MEPASCLVSSVVLSFAYSVNERQLTTTILLSVPIATADEVVAHRDSGSIDVRIDGVCLYPET
jgi:hypothetical protein